MKNEPFHNNDFDEYLVSYVFSWDDKGNSSVHAKNLKNRNEFANFIFKSLLNSLSSVIGDFESARVFSPEGQIRLKCNESSDEVAVELSIDSRYKPAGNKLRRQ